MATITEDYVSFETAKLLKEKGFDEPCFAYYYVMPHKTAVTYDTDFPKNSDLCLTHTNMEFGSLPTLQMAMKWLRKVHNIVIEITAIWIVDFGYNYVARIVVEGESKKILKHYNHHKEACEAAIKYCLENLI